MGSRVYYARRARCRCSAEQVKHPGSYSPVDGLVELMQGAIGNYQAPLMQNRLQRWQTALFAGSTIGGLADIRRIAVGRYRTQVDGM